MNLRALRAKLAQLKSQGLAKLAELRALETKIAALTGDEAAAAEASATALEGEVDALHAEVQALTASIATEERRVARDAAFQGSAAAGGRPPAAPLSHEPNPADTGGFANVADFAAAVASAGYGNPLDPRLAALPVGAPAGTMSNGGTAGEGFLVPTDFRESIWEAVSAPGDLLADCDTDTTQANRVGIIKDETTAWGSSGIVARWRAEAEKMDAGKFTTKGAEVPLNELYAFTLVTDEVLEDSPLLASRLTTKAGAAIRWTASDAVMWGDGVGKMLGFMQSKALVTVAKETGQSAGTVLAENIAKMYARLLPGNLGGAKWLANSEILPQLVTLKLGPNPIWTPPAAGLAQAPGGFLMGRPIEFTEHSAALGDLGDLVLVDLKGYYAPTKASGINFASSIHLFFDRGIQAFRWNFRVGGQPYLSAPVKPARGDATKSHFVALAPRQ